MTQKQALILILFLLLSLRSLGVINPLSPHPRLLNDFWTAWWISHPTASGVEFGVYHFRKDFTLEQIPEAFIINVSADNRYKLFVNSHEVCFGPARGDLANWYYETIDIAPWLSKGDNVIAAVVWNFSTVRPWAQFSLQTAFLVQGNTIVEEIVNTNSSWKVYKNGAYSALSDFSHLQTFIVVGPGEKTDGHLYPWGWADNDFSTATWPAARQLVNAKPRGKGTDIDWVMTPRDIPLMENKIERLSQIRHTEGTTEDVSGIISGKATVIPANSRVSILIDNGHLTKGYPVLQISGGKESKITLTYAEALLASDSNHPDLNARKRNRNQTEGMEIRGLYDVFIADGGHNRTFSPLWYRTYRYIKAEIETAAEDLIIHDLYGIFSAYPFEQKAAFRTLEPLYDEIWEVGWRTARLCAHETFYDCPYYEQMQYVGDTRIQALVSLYVSGDDLLARKALHMFDISRNHEGITQSRYPTYSPQFIPPYSLVWINMIHDYYLLRSDRDFISGFHQGIKNILSWYENHIDPHTGMLGAVPYWNFVDWAEEWPWDNTVRAGGVPAGGMEGNSSILTLQLAYTLREAAALMKYYEDYASAEKYLQLAGKLNRATLLYTWCDTRQMIADTPEKKSFSQHAGIMGILSGAVDEDKKADLMEKILEDPTLIQATMYFRFYLFLAMIEAGYGNQIAGQLGQWEEMLALGLTTFAEKPEPTRSDCHAWSASPLYFFLSSMAGIGPDAPGFSEVKIEPRPGDLNSFEASMPHPAGEIRVHATQLNTSQPGFIIHLPDKITGRLIWKNREYLLEDGGNTINL